ncbi:putative glutamine amidotransferase [Agromyces flavus]|uniref:Glutamine amidotransferase n=1 Tax=Agromyces flavus TaxID=589382 RepID=A0A1H1TH44_9MICO|nr:gamma-glutamyl-gamma-aminobutyrate hydrolase family protein [Agromyces flavus]MCP2368424.1 putative glutamine amidotransferase [Agromyces flavus]GGI47884.1 gamma-glutamyl-gamma-aminobutyrate hydrolase [Agromyces flavus]SDS59542.1 putative glutamine amidotransferase [Agromyces flavus]
MASSASEAGRATDAAAPTSEATAPLIGVTTYLERSQTGVWDVPASFLPKVYLDAVTDAGGIAVLLPPQPASPDIARRVLGSLDGLIVSGGADVDPRRYGQEPHARTGAPRTDRDEWEDALLTAAIELDVPFLGICRGAQMLNVALGGTLVQHLPDVVGHEGYQPAPAVFGETVVSVGRGSRLDAMLGTAEDPDGSVPVHVYHHQAIDRVAEGLAVTARTDDGVIEAVELEGAAFGVAVQWHPEENAADRRLFAGLVEAARHHRTGRTSE